MNRNLFLFLSLLLFCISAKAQTSPQLSSSEILLGLKKLNTIGSVLYIAAHPDDENTRLLSYLSKEKKLRTGYLSITRGDGGQNLVGKEQGDALGVIRTQELLAARRVDGAEQFFTRANDFGYSKTPEETFNIWSKDSVLADVVWVIRKFKPDVIICRFPTTGEGGHGHHTASAILAEEAFDAAADPKMFPEQLAHVQVWQAKRLFWNTFNFGTTNTTSPDQLKIDVGVYNPLLGKSYGEIAAESRSMHKSQGFGSSKGRGASLEYFKQLKGDSAKNDLFEGIDLTWSRFPSTARFNKLINDCILKYDAQAPDKIVPQLSFIVNELLNLDASNPDVSYWKVQKIHEALDLLLASTGLWMEAYASDYIAIPRREVNITTQIIKRSSSEVKLTNVTYLDQKDTAVNLTLNKNELYTFKDTIRLTENIPFSNHYWLNESHSIGIFNVKERDLIGTPENKSTANVNFYIDFKGVNNTIVFTRPLVYKFTDPVKGEVYRPLEILPPATINLTDKVFVFTGDEPKNIQLTVKANAANVSGTVEINATEGWSVMIRGNNFQLTNKGDEAIINATITPGKNATVGSLKALIKIDGMVYSKSIQRINYDHIPSQFILSEATAELVNVNLKKEGTSIGYIPGAGDDIPAALKQVGFNVTTLTDEALSSGDISKYNAIVTGVRAYNTNERLQVHYNKLMQYVNNGGNLIVQYNTNNRFGPVTVKVGPYPFTISRERVTDESAEVRIINSGHPALNYPNKITERDFEGWRQERGIYFATDPDKNFETLLSMNDANSKPSEGSLIIAKYGKGNFVYTGLAFFRQLPAGNPGAYRLFVNLLSLPKNDK